MRILLATLLLLAVIPAYGSIIVVSGVTVLSTPPPSVAAGQLMSDTTIYGFSEQTNVTLTSSVNAGITTPGAWVCCTSLSPGVIPAGTVVNSYLLRAAPETNADGFTGRDFQGQISFSPGEHIVGIIIGYTNIANTDGMLGAPGTMYPPGTYQNGGLEPGTSGDEIFLSGNYSSVYLNLHVAAGNMDMVRILTTTTPEPAEFILLGSGLAVLAFCKRKFRSRRTEHIS